MSDTVRLCLACSVPLLWDKLYEIWYCPQCAACLTAPPPGDKKRPAIKRDVQELVEDKRRTAVVTGLAPCGHYGEHVFGGYVRCVMGCEGPRPAKIIAPKARPACDPRTHGRSKYIIDGTVHCGYCDEIIKE